MILNSTSQWREKALQDVLMAIHRRVVVPAAAELRARGIAIMDGGPDPSAATYWREMKGQEIPSPPQFELEEVPVEPSRIRDTADRLAAEWRRSDPFTRERMKKILTLLLAARLISPAMRRKASGKVSDMIYEMF